MKASFFSVFALAISAIAAPVSDNLERSEVAPYIEAREVTDFLAEKRTIFASADLIARLDSCNSAVAAVTVNIDAKVGAIGKGKGKITADACAQASLPHLQSTVNLLTTLKADIKAAGKLKVSADADIKVILNLIVKLITNILVCTKKLTIAVGLRVELKAILVTCFSLLADVLTLVCGIAPGIFAQVTASLNPLFISARASVIAPCLGAVFGAAGGIRAGLNISLSAKLGITL